MQNLARLRAFILPGIPLYIFLGALFFFTILGNLLYATPFGVDLPSFNVRDFSWGQFHEPFGLKFWLLLFLPVILSPIAFGVRRVASPLALTISPIIPEIPKTVFLITTIALYAFAIKALIDADALGRFLSGHNAVGAVENRFSLLAVLGFKPQMVLKSLLVFLSVYGAVRAAREGRLFWPIATGVNVVVLTICLVLLNMKWPAVLYILTLGVCVFATAKRHPYIKAAAITASGIALFFVLSAVLLRWFPEPEVVSVAPIIVQQKPPSISQEIQQGPILTPQPATKNPITAFNTLNGAIFFSPAILTGAINRMAVSVPFYFQFHAFAGDNCKAALWRMWMKRPLACEPSLIVYTALFGYDEFANRGTAPAAVNLYSYALAGWPGAIFETTLTLVILGLFLAVWGPAQNNAVAMAAFVMGSYAGYSFSQLPVEGPIIYDTGMLWWTLMMAVWIAVYWGYRLLKGSSGAKPGHALHESSRTEAR